VSAPNSQRIYVDSNIFLNIWFEESEKPDLLSSSLSTLDDVYNCKYVLVVSKALVREISEVSGLSMERTELVMLRPYMLLGKVEWVKFTSKIADEAIYLESIYGIHRLDALHAAMASMYDCWLVTFDHDLKKAAKKAGIQVRDPRELV
jgi:predicted nucleic acid-binding protein